MNANLYPWQLKNWQYLQNLETNGHLPHALLISGENNGELSFAKNFIQYLLCSEQCGECQSCRWFKNNAHPDCFLLISENGDNIKVDEVRELTSWLDTRPQSKYKIALIAPAEQMTLAAANSLLKKLEEPVGNKIIILVSHHTRNLLPTIRSRCQEIHLAAPTLEEAINWLLEKGIDAESELIKLFQDNPLNAIAMAEDENCLSYLTNLNELFENEPGQPQLIEKNNLNLNNLFEITWRFMHERIKIMIKNNQARQVNHSLKLIDFIVECKKNLNHSININEDLVRENLRVLLMRIAR